MKVVCSYCARTIEDERIPDDDRVSHGLCSACDAYFSRQWFEPGLNLGEFLDRFTMPVMVMDGNARVVAANRAMARRLNARPRELHGLLGGQVMECPYARLPDGCGQTVHCRDCTIRLTVRSVVESGEEVRSVPVRFDRGRGSLRLVVSAFPKGDSVVVVVEEFDETSAATAGDPAHDQGGVWNGGGSETAPRFPEAHGTGAR